MKILIFGANGFVGPYLINEFLNKDYEVSASDLQEDLFTEGFREKLFEGREVGYFSCDILSSNDVEKLITQEKPDGIINLAAISSVGQSWSIPAKTMEINVIGTLNILEAVRKVKAESKETSDVYSPKLLLIGSSEEYEMTEDAITEETPLDASNPYGISKIAQEHFAEIYSKNYNLDISYIRAFNHTGIGQRETFVLPSFVRQVAELTKKGEEGTISVGNLNIYRDFSDVRDIVRGYRMVFEQMLVEKSDKDLDDKRTLPIYNIGSGTAYNLGELLDYIISLSSEKILTRIDPSRYRPVDQLTIKADATKLRTELGWNPEYTIYDTLKEMFDYFLND